MVLCGQEGCEIKAQVDYPVLVGMSDPKREEVVGLSTDRCQEIGAGGARSAATKDLATGLEK